MELHIYLAFIISTTIMIALPGPSVLLTVAHSISFGWKHGIATVAGATLGIAIQLAISTIGLASLLNTVAEAFEWLRWIGVAYLIYLGIKQWRSADQSFEFDSSSASKQNVFVQGLVTTILNPKSLIFIAAFLPQFIDTTKPLELQLMIIVTTFLMIAFTVTSIWALIAGKIRNYIKRPKAINAVVRTSGGLMILAGIGLSLARRGK